MTESDRLECLFCGIVAGDVKADIVRQTERTVAFRDINPQAPTHVLVVPREHHVDVGAMAAADALLAGEVLRECAEVALDEGMEAYRVIFNTGSEAGQSVFHVHAHVLAGRSLTWPPG